MKSHMKNISQKSLEDLCICLMNSTDEEGFLLNISPTDAFQDWLLEKFPEPVLKFFSSNKHYYQKDQEQ